MTIEQFVEIARQISRMYPGQVLHVSYTISPRNARQHQVSFDVAKSAKLWRRDDYGDICPAVLVRDGILLVWPRDLFGGGAA